MQILASWYMCQEFSSDLSLIKNVRLGRVGRLQVGSESQRIMDWHAQSQVYLIYELPFKSII